MFKAKSRLTFRIGSAALSLLFLLAPLSPVVAAKVKRQDPVTGAFAGNVSVNGDPARPVMGAQVEIQNVQTGAKYRRVTDASGGFYVGRLSPGEYRITVVHPSYNPKVVVQRLQISQVNTVLPVPVNLEPLAAVAPTPAPITGPTPPDTAAAATPTPSAAPTPDTGVEVERINLQVGRLDGRRGGGYNENQVATLPLGAATYVRTFDELALLLPGVTLPPFTLGNVAGPGVGPGVGSAGQFSVNGLPPRTNNFTVDGSDNNDEDIGVRRQGFFSLVPQPVESIKEYQVITLLAPAQFGRNIGAQVNAVSKSGGNDVHGDLYGFFNSSALNARGFFDTDGTNGATQLNTAGGRSVVICGNANANSNLITNPCTGATALNVDHGFGGEDSSTLGQFGFTFGGPIKKERWFYFLSGERQVLNASEEKSFAVPTVEQRGFGLPPGTAQQAFFHPLDPRSGSGATGFDRDPLSLATFSRVVPQTLFGAAVFSLFPFPNNPNGVYGANTFTQVLPASGKGVVASGKLDYVNTERRLFQSFTARYNFTQDWRDLPAAGGAIFAALRPATRTQNISSFLNSELSGPDAGTQVYNQVRFSYGRTRLRFDELRDPSLLGSNFGGFLLNRPLLQDVALTDGGNVPFTRVTGSALGSGNRCPNGAAPAANEVINTECITGPVGQVIIGGFSPVGVDVYNFPQRRVNNTYQLADTMTIRESGRRGVTYTFGTDIRRSELNSALPRNSRPLITFFGSTSLQNNPANPTDTPPGCGGVCEVDPNRIPYIPATWLAAAGVPSGFFQSLAAPGREDGEIRLRYYQFNFFGQEDFRLTNSLSVTLGLRYEYNTPVKEVNGQIEQFYALSPALNPLGILAQRDSIYDPDRNNIAPRAGFAWAPKIFGAEHPSVIRAGFGVYYDQILGSVASQSRNVFPGFLPLNVAATNSTLGLPFALPRNLTLGNIQNNLVPTGSRLGPCIVQIFGPACIQSLDASSQPITLFAAGANNLNTFNPIFDPNSGSFNAQQLGNLIAALRFDLPSSFAFTLPSTRLSMPMAYHYSYTIEQGLPHNMLVSAGYVGTKGRNLIRVTTPNGGPNNFPIIGTINTAGFAAGVNGAGIRNNSVQTPNRVNGFLGALNIIETTGRSQYDAFQAQLRGRLSRERPFLYQVGYTYSRSRDSVSDVFDLAGASALPQQSTTFSGNQTLSITGGNFPGEYARSNYDTPHRVSYDLVWDLVPGRNGLQLASTGMFQSGQPFTVNSIIDVNKDGNLTDRLNTAAGLTLNGSDRSPIVLATGNSGENLTCAVGTTTRVLPVSGENTRSLLACQGFNGSLPRNSFRAGAFRLINLTAIKKFQLGETTALSARLDVFNLLDRDNFNIPVRILESPGFGSATETVTPGRRLQFGLKLSF